MFDILEHYPRPLAAGVLTPWPGGFSGARLWRLRTSLGDFCLKAAPGDVRHLAWIHEQLARVRALDFVPKLIATRCGVTWVCHDGLLWELQTWMPGRADFHEAPSDAKLRHACRALAELHRAWGTRGEVGPCPAVRRRVEILRSWQGLGDSPLPIARILPQRISEALTELQPWLARPVPLQTCLCDGWHDHFLFEGERLTGVIDFGSVKLDHRAVDLARLLGSMVPDGPWHVGLGAYHEVLPLSAEDLELIPLLERTGLTVAVLRWLDWLTLRPRTFADPARARRHAERLFARFLKPRRVRYSEPLG